MDDGSLDDFTRRAWHDDFNVIAGNPNGGGFEEWEWAQRCIRALAALAASEAETAALELRLTAARERGDLFEAMANGREELLTQAHAEIRSLESETAALREQIDKLASFIMYHIPGEPSRSEGAVDTAIRLLGSEQKRQHDLRHVKALLRVTDQLESEQEKSRKLAEEVRDLREWMRMRDILEDYEDERL